LLVGVTIRKLLWQGEEMCLLGVNYAKVFSLLKWPPSWPSHEMKQLKKPNLLEWGQQ